MVATSIFQEIFIHHVGCHVLVEEDLLLRCCGFSFVCLVIMVLGTTSYRIYSCRFYVGFNYSFKELPLIVVQKQATSSSAAVNNTATVSRATLSDKAPLEELANVEEPRSIKAEHGDILQRPISSKPAAGPDLEVQRPTVPFKDALETHPHVLNRPLILYAYSESKNARKNLEFFLAHGIHAAADFVFILNGHTDVASSIPVADNIRYVQRPNDCYDLGAYAEVLTTDDLYRRYRKFIMLNASIRGPFLPYWAESCWSDMYLKRVTNEVKVRPSHLQRRERNNH